MNDPTAQRAIESTSPRTKLSMRADDDLAKNVEHDLDAEDDQHDHDDLADVLDELVPAVAQGIADREGRGPTAATGARHRLRGPAPAGTTCRRRPATSQDPVGYRS